MGNRRPNEADHLAPATDNEGEERANLLFAQMAEHEAQACDAHVRDWWVVALFESKLLQLQSVEAEERIDASRWLLERAASFVAGGKHLPPPLRPWLSKALRHIARGTRANEAFGLTPGRGRRENLLRQLKNAAQVYALMQWRKARLGQAAAAALATAERDDGSSGVLDDSSALEKAYRAIRRDWTISGPFLADSIGRPIGDEAASEDDLRRGESVSVLFKHKKAILNVCGVLLPQQLTNSE